MAKAILGIDIGYDQLKLALVKGNRILKTVTGQMPENLIREGRITSRETMGEVIRTTMKENGIRAHYASFALPNEAVYVKNVVMPEMTVEQLQFNLPFEFNDYITGELKDYVFDYAVISDANEENEDEGVESRAEVETSSGEEAEDEPAVIRLMAVGTQRSYLEDVHDIARFAGLRVKRVAPAMCSYISLLRQLKEKLFLDTQESGILDLGYAAIRMYMFRGDVHVATRVLEIGLSSVDDVLSDVYGVDVHLAHTYLLTNYEDCQSRQECMSAYQNIAVELMRALNFYRFSNPDSQLGDVWLCGGGAAIVPLCKAIESTLEMRIHPAYELMPGSNPPEISFAVAEAVGAALD